MTGASRLLVGGPELDSAPGYSPDGTRVAFFRDVDCCPKTVDLVVVDADGSGLFKVNSEPLVEDLTLATGYTGQPAPGGDPWGAMDTVASISSMPRGSEPPRQLVPDMDVSSPAFRPPNGQELGLRGDRQRQVPASYRRPNGPMGQAFLERFWSRMSRSTWVTTPSTWSTRPTGSASSIRADTPGN